MRSFDLGRGSLVPDNRRSAHLYDGVAEYSTFNGAAPSLLGDFSVEVWVKVTPGSPSTSIETIWSVHTVGGTNRLILNVNYGIDADPTVYFAVWSQPDVGIVPGPAGGTDIKDGNWHHMVMSHELSTNTIKVYVDSVLELTHAAAGPFGLLANSRVTVGQEWDGAAPSDFLQGRVSAHRLYSRVLTLPEVQALYNDGAGRSARGFAAVHDYWMGDSEAQFFPTIIDRGPGKANGTMVAMELADIVADAP